VAEAALGWQEGQGGTWLVPIDRVAWHVVAAAHLGRTPPDEVEASRALRSAVVEAAHAVDLRDIDPPRGSAVERKALETTVDSWVLGPPPLPPDSRHLAALGLRILSALDAAVSLVDTVQLESAARDAIESAFTTASGPR
jgi:hypothetical protein